MFNINNKLRTVAAGLVLTMGAFAANSAYAAPTFQVNPNSNGLGAAGSVFTADGLTGNSSARISRVGMTNNYTGTGYIVYSAFTLNDNPVSAGATRLNVDYLLYATFNQTFACSGPLAVGVSCAVTSVSLEVFLDRGAVNTYNQATLGANPSVTVNGTSDVKLADVTAVTGPSFGGISGSGGAFQNINTDFHLTTEGMAYFINPTPFYNFAFSSFNNTSQGIQCAPSCGSPAITTVAITQESGFTDFNGQPVPEPGPLALIGLGLLGLVAARRTKKAA